jgi:hypothetical protein
MYETNQTLQSNERTLKKMKKKGKNNLITFKSVMEYLEIFSTSNICILN